MSRTLRFHAKPLVVASSLLVVVLLSGFEKPAVRIEPTTAGPRELEDLTQKAVLRGYLHSWQTLSAALEQNRLDLLDADFVGVARDTLADTIRQQKQLGLQTRYQDRSHNISLVFYSPEGLSVQLTDIVEYDIQIKDHGQHWTSHRIRSRYVAVLTPTEVRWKVRILQAHPE